MVTPQLTPTATAHILSYYQKKDYADDYNNEYSIYISITGQDSSKYFELLETQHESDLELYYTYREISLSDYIDQPIYIAFVMTNDDGDNWTIDEVNLSNCPVPSGIYAESITGIGAELHWEDDGADSWDIEIVKQDNKPTGTPDFEGINTNFLLWEGGLSLTGYDVYVTSNCSDDKSNISEPFSFITSCSGTECEYQLVLADSYGDRWNGAYIEIRQNGTSVSEITMTDNGFEPQYFPFSMCEGTEFELVWHSGNWDSECIFQFYDPFQQLYHSFKNGQSPPNDSVFFSNIADCTPVSCRFPYDLVAKEISETGAKLYWEETDNASVWDIIIVEHGQKPDGIPTVEGVTTIPYNWTGGESNKYYDFYVRSVCALDDKSAWAFQPYTFATRCDGLVSNYPYSEDFITDNLLPSCWNTEFKGEGNNRWYSTIERYSEDTVVVCKHQLEEQDVWLLSPDFDFSNLTSTVSLSFDWKMSYYWMVYPYNEGDLQLLASTDGGVTWSKSIWSEDTVGEFSSFVWSTSKIDISSYIGNPQVIFAFRYTGYNAATVYLNNFEIIEESGIINSSESINEHGLGKIYPIPTNDFITIEYNARNTSPVHLSMIDILGKSVDLPLFNPVLGENDIFVDVSGFSSGIYFLRVECEGLFWVEEVVVF